MPFLKEGLKEVIFGIANKRPHSISNDIQDFNKNCVFNHNVSMKNQTDIRYLFNGMITIAPVQNKSVYM